MWFPNANEASALEVMKKSTLSAVTGDSRSREAYIDVLRDVLHVLEGPKEHILHIQWDKEDDDSAVKGDM